jgi:hypothetical protein
VTQARLCDVDGWNTSTVTSYREYDKARRAVLEMESDSTIWGPMKYPEHPFPPEICSKLARMAHGLAVLCMTGTISCPLITALSMISSSFATESLETRHPKSHTVSRINAAICIRLLQSLRLSLAEQLLLLAVCSFCFFKGGDPESWQNADGYVQVSFIRLLNRPLPEMEGSERAMLWEAMVLRAAFGWDTPTREYSDLILCKVKTREPELYDRRYEVVDEFMWDVGLTQIVEREGL